jgi:nifR3 family TIM-barrel protein
MLIDPPLYLAPMEGVTDPSFRALSIETNGTDSLGAVCTEFLRVSNVPLPEEYLRDQLGTCQAGVLNGIQLMGNKADLMAETAIRAASAGAAFVDLNFGCPAPKVYQHRAGSALLDQPQLLEDILSACVEACPAPVTAKIRAGGTNPDTLEEICKRVENAGAVMLTVHARLRTDRYTDPPNWDWIRFAKETVGIPVFGNGNADSVGNIEAMLKRTGCDGIMIGRGALQDPILFRRWRDYQQGITTPDWSNEEIVVWLREYHRRMLAGGAKIHQALGRIKHAVKALGQSGKVNAEKLPFALREHDLDDLLAQLGLTDCSST